jgi:hypothetical protein
MPPRSHAHVEDSLAVLVVASSLHHLVRLIHDAVVRDRPLVPSFGGRDEGETYCRKEEDYLALERRMIILTWKAG